MNNHVIKKHHVTNNHKRFFPLLKKKQTVINETFHYQYMQYTLICLSSLLAKILTKCQKIGKQFLNTRPKNSGLVKFPKAVQMPIL